MTGLRRALAVTAGALVGALFAALGLLGTEVSTDEGEPPTEILALESWCQHEFGDDATAYLPYEPAGWSCGAWTNGMWGLEPLDIHDACRWQRGEDARVGKVDRPQREVPCTA